MDPDVLQSIETIAKTGLTAWASKDLVSKVLGPTADYVGKEVASFADKCNVNLSDIFARAARKLGPRLEEPGQVPPRILKGVLEDGGYVADPVTAEYFAGVLAASRSPTGRDDRGNSVLAVLRQMSVYDMRLHYLLYRSFKEVYEGDARRLSISDDSQDMLLFIPLSVYLEVMEFGEGEDPDVICGHSLRTILRCGLALSGARGEGQFLSRWSRSIDQRGLLFQASGFGAELYCWAHGAGHIEPGRLIEPGLRLESCHDVPYVRGAIRAPNDGSTRFGRPS